MTQKQRQRKKIYWAVVPTDPYESRMDGILTVYPTRQDAKESHWMDWEIEGENGRPTPAYKVIPVTISPITKRR